MVRQLEAVFERGVLRPLDPLFLPENKRVFLTISDVGTPAEITARTAEQEWLRAHADEYRGQWVALQASELVSYGSDARLVIAEAHRKGFERPLLVHVPKHPDEPLAGWL